MNESFSVLMSTYAGERAEHLEAALRSLEEQLVQPAEVVLVVDGPVPEELEDVLRRAREFVQLEIIRLPTRGGLASALNAGLPFCTTDWVARMDSDDICVPERFYVQFQMIAGDPSLDLIAAWHAEFDADPQLTTSVKSAPAHHDAIARRLRWRNVLSHPTVVVRRAVLEAVGGYSDVTLLEDWDLYLRLLRHGARFAVAQAPLVHVRVSGHAERRGGLRYALREFAFRARCLRRGDIGLLEFLVLSLGYGCWRLLPARGRRLLYPLVRTRAEVAP